MQLEDSVSDARLPSVTLRLLGSADLQGLDRSLSDPLLGQPKVVGMLAYLAIAGADGGWLRRDTLAALLWPELDQTHARAALRKAVLAVRSALGTDALLGRGDEELRLSETAIECDAVVFARHIDRGNLEKALDLYRGELLPGFHIPGCAELDRWLDGERAEARLRASAAAWAWAETLEGNSAQTLAAHWARRAVRFSWDDERLLRRTLTLLNRVGDRAGALRLYDEFARRLKTDFDAEPSAETLALMRQMRGETRRW